MGESLGNEGVDDEDLCGIVGAVGFDTSGGNFLYLFRIDTLAPRICMRTLFFSINFFSLSKRWRERRLL